MEVSSPQLAQAIAAARIALAEAFVLKVGQTLQAVVAGKGGDGLTLLKIGEQVVKAALPETLPPGTTLQLQVKSAGKAPQLVILAQKLPQGGGAPADVAAPEPRGAPAPVAAQEVAGQPRPAAANSQSPPRVAPIVSQVESGGPEGGRAKGDAPAGPGGPVRVVPAPRPAAPEAVDGPAGPMAGAPVAAPSRPQAAEIVAKGPAASPAPSMSPPAPSPAGLELAVPAGSLRPTAATPLAPAGSAAGAVVAPEPMTARGQPASSMEPQTLPVPETAAPSRAASAVTLTVPTPGARPVQVLPTASPVEPEMVHPLLVAQAAPRPPATAAELPRPVAGPVPQSPTPAPAAPPVTPQAALAQMLPEALARQDSVGPLLQSLATLVQRPAMLPEPVLRAALGVLAQRVVATGGKVEPADIERAVVRSGLGLEARLANGGAPAQLDAKAGLLTLRAALAKWLGEATPPAPQRPGAAPPPLRGLPLRAPALDVPPLPDMPREALHAVHGQADAAISRLKLMQVASLPDADPARPAPPALRLEMPLLVGHELVMAQLQVSRDGTRRAVERKRGWTMRFALNYSATGEVGAEIGLLGKAVNVALWAAEPETAEAMRAALPQLGGALEAIGLKPGALRIRHGAPEPEKPVSGQLLDSVS